MSLEEIMALPVAECANENSHLYLWVPNALLPEGLEVMKSWGFRYVSNIIWAKRRKDGGPDGIGVGFYFRNVTEILLFEVRGHMCTPPGRSQVNMIETRKREHSRKPDEQYDLIESCSPGPYLEMVARYPRPNWIVWGAEASEDVVPKGKRYPGYFGGEIESQSQEIMLPLYPHQRLCDDTNEALAALFAKRYSEGGSIREIAMETGFSIARVRSLLTLAKVEFRARGRSRS